MVCMMVNNGEYIIYHLYIIYKWGFSTHLDETIFRKTCDKVTPFEVSDLVGG